ncbi:MAG: hypothetical protein QOE82_144 [Thermoanaerobaculia bacterium]|jgi:hypothetical protein|nr:hypothetical protein [Thermoanaerobaculia bacterium]
MAVMILALLLAVHFVPATSLNAPATPASNDALRQIAAIHWDDRNGCLPPMEVDIDAESAGTKQFPELARYLGPSETIVAGRVESVIPGWDTVAHRPATLISMRVTDALRGGSKDELVTFQIDGGRVVVAGRAICSEGHMAIPRAGDTLLVAGTRDAAQPGHIVSSSDTVFRVQEQSVIVPPSLNLAGKHHVPLSSLRYQLIERIEKK